MAVALHGAALSGVVDVAEPALRALTKVVPMLPPGLRGSADALRSMVVTQPPVAGTDAGVAPEVLAVVAQACRDGVRLRFGYTTNDGTSAERTTDPLRLVTLGRRWYLVAFDLDRDDWRTFRLDRLTEPRASRNTVPRRSPPSEDLAAYVREGVARSRPTQEVVVVVDAPVAEVATTVGRWGVATDAGDGRTRIVMEADGFEWPILLLAMIDAPVQVERPAAFGDRLHRLGARFVDAGTLMTPVR